MLNYLLFSLFHYLGSFIRN